MLKVNVDIESIAGYSACARDMLKAFDQNEVDYFINPIVWGDTSVELEPYWSSKIALKEIYKLKDYDITLSIGLPDRHYLIEEGKYNIGYTHWEVTKIGEEWVKNMNAMDEIWTSSEFAKEVFISSGLTKPCTVVRWPIFKLPDIEPSIFSEYQNNNFSFLHMGTFDARKNFRDAIVSYCYEFSDIAVDINGETPNNDYGTILILKTYRSFDDIVKRKIEQEIYNIRESINLKRNPMIVVSQEKFTDSVLLQKLKSIDCLLYPTHGEGVGGPAMFAQQLGKPVICPKFSALKEYVDTEYWVDHCLEPVTGMTHIQPYKCSPMWARINIESLRKQMRRAYNNRSKKPIVHKGYTAKEVSESVKNRIEEILK